MRSERTRSPFSFEQWTGIQMARDARIVARFGAWYERLAALPRPTRRWLRRKWAMTLAAAALLIALSGMPVYAATITVDPGASGINPGAGCSLVEAIINANDNAATYSECVAGSGADTITLPTSATLNYATAYGTNAALPDVTDTLTIEGNSSTIQRDDSAGYFRLFNAYNGDFTLNDTTITKGDLGTSGPSGDPGYLGGGMLLNGGNATLNDCTVTGNTAIAGGGVYVYDGTLTVNGSTISENYGTYVGGGIVASYDTGLAISTSTISGNTAYGGGGVSLQTDATIVSSTITNNTAIFGGGILFYAYGKTVTIAESTISGNHATLDDPYSPASGGGIFSFLGTLYVIKSTISNNDADIYGGGIFSGIPFGMKRDAVGMPKLEAVKDKSGTRQDHRTTRKESAGVRDRTPGKKLARLDKMWKAHESAKPQAPRAEEDLPPTLVALTNSTISGNTATEGAGLTNDLYMALFNTTVTNNTATEYAGGISNAGLLGLARSLVSGNNAPQYSEIDSCGCGGTYADEYNLFGDNSKTNAQAFYGLTPGPTDITATSDGTMPTALASILNTTLGNNGGPTQTNALVANSPAIDKAPSADCTAPPVDGVDQRGFLRNVNGSGGPSSNECDIGAYEFAASTAVNVTGLRARIGKVGNLNLRWQSTSELQIAGFNVYRRVDSGEWKQINRQLLQAKHPGNVTGAKYHFKDKAVRYDKTYRYKIEVLYLDKHTEWTDVIKVKR